MFLHANGIPTPFVMATMTITNTEAVVLYADGEIDTFDISAGVLQGDTLAPVCNSAGLYR